MKAISRLFATLNSLNKTAGNYRVLGLTLVLLVAAVPLMAQSGAPPIIDRELFFGDPEISGAQISPDGQFIAFIKPLKGTRNIWVKRTADSFASAKPITAETSRPIRQYFWSHDAKYVLYAQDKGGDENFNVYAVNPAESPAAGQDVPAARNLTDLKGVGYPDLRCAPQRSRRDLRGPQRSRQVVARSLQGEDFEWRAHLDPKEYRTHRGLDF